MGPDNNKELVRRLIEEAINGRKLDVVDELADGELATAAKRWIGPFRTSFPDFTMKIVDLVGEGDTVVGHFQCSGTHRGEWNGIAPTGKRFEGVDEIYIFRVRDGKLSDFVAVETISHGCGSSASNSGPPRFASRFDRAAAVRSDQCARVCPGYSGHLACSYYPDPALLDIKLEIRAVPGQGALAHPARTLDGALTRASSS